MSASRKPIRKPGKKTGARINHTLALKPLGIRNLIAYELPTRAAIVALESKAHTSDHLAHLYSLGDMARRISSLSHIQSHAASVMRMCESIHQSGGCSAMVVDSMSVSTNLLLEWINQQSNAAISLAANKAIKELAA